MSNEMTPKEDEMAEKRKPTIAELEKILSDPNPRMIQLHHDGSITSEPDIDALIRAAVETETTTLKSCLHAADTAALIASGVAESLRKELENSQRRNRNLLDCSEELEAAQERIVELGVDNVDLKARIADIRATEPPDA